MKITSIFDYYTIFGDFRESRDDKSSKLNLAQPQQEPADPSQPTTFQKQEQARTQVAEALPTTYNFAPAELHELKHFKHYLKMTSLRTILLLAAIGVTSVEGFTPRIQSLKSVKPDHLRYIATEEVVIRESSVVLPISQAIHKRLSQRPTISKPKRSSAHAKVRSPKIESRNLNNDRHSASDWWHNLRTLPQSSILKEIKHPVMALTGWATFISIVHKVLLMKGKAQLAASISVPMVAHSLLVSSLGLLLVFRTNSSYQRFLEGRQIWERILSTSRNLSRMATIYRDDIGKDELARMKNLIASFPYLLRHHIRSGCLCSTDPTSMDARYKLQLQDVPKACVDTRYEGDKACILEQEAAELRKCFVDKRDLPWSMLDDPQRDTLLKVARSTNRPLWICDRLSLEISKIPYTNSFTSRERLTLLKSVDDLASTVGQCERIRQTAVPLNYARHALRSLSLWLLTLPFCMVKDLGLLTGPATAAMSWILFGVYQIGYSIEDPFKKSLRLSILCDAIRHDVIGNESESAFYIEEDEEDEYSEIREPHSLKGLTGKEVDELDEADVNVIFVRAPTARQQQMINNVNIDRKQSDRGTMTGVAKSLMP